MKIKQIGVSSIAYGVALKAVPLALIGYAQLHSRRALKPQRLLVNGDPFPRHPHVLCLLIQLIKQITDLPQRIRLLLFLGALMVVSYGEVPMEVFPTKSRFYRLPVAAFSQCRALLIRLLPSNGSLSSEQNQ